VADDTLQQRIDAVEAFSKHPEDAAARVKYWRQLHPNSGKKDASGFITYWNDHWKQHSHILDIKQPGRPDSISDKEALKAVYLFGIDKYKTLAVGAEDVPFIKHLLSRKGMTTRMLTSYKTLGICWQAQCHLAVVAQ